MFTPRVVLFCLGLAVCAALPPTPQTPENPGLPRPIIKITEEDLYDSPWFSFPLFGNLFAPLWKLFPSFADIGPKFIADNDKFQVVVNVKEYKKNDLKVKVKNDLIIVQGSHEGKQDDRDVFASQFFQTYSLPTNCSSAEVTANLTNDGYLVVTAPIKFEVERTKVVDREIPITETGAPYQPPKEENSTLVPSTLSTISVVPTEDTRESTTPSEREETTEKDNSIPHGNEVNSI